MTKNNKIFCSEAQLLPRVTILPTEKKNENKRHPSTSLTNKTTHRSKAKLLREAMACTLFSSSLSLQPSSHSKPRVLSAPPCHHHHRSGLSFTPLIGHKLRLSHRRNDVVAFAVSGKFFTLPIFSSLFVN